MKIITLKNLSQKEKDQIINRNKQSDLLITKTITSIINDVKKTGDKAVRKYLKKFNQTEVKKLQVTSQEIKQAYSKVDNDYLKALDQAIKNIYRVAKSQLKVLDSVKIETEKSIKVWREWRPIERVGIYVPGGKASYPSSLLMCGVLAKIAGCKEIIVCTPPNQKGLISAAVLVAADKIGIKKIYKIGGAEAIAAMAYGTETISKVYKIFGPGNQFVTQAKLQVFGEVNIDMPAGPSEVFIIADESANPRFVAADLLADSEHGEDSAAVLLTTSSKLADEVVKEINFQLVDLSTAERIKSSLKKFGLFGIAESLDEAIEFSNEYAPEHLELMVNQPENLIPKIKNAGSVFLGPWTAKAAGDYATGANHILPTGGRAKMFNPLSIESFGKMMEVQKVSKIGLKKIRKTIEILALLENLPAHKFSSEVRFKNESN